MVSAVEHKVHDRRVADQGIVDVRVVGDVAKLEADNGRVGDEGGAIDVVAVLVGRKHDIEIGDVEAFEGVETYKD